MSISKNVRKQEDIVKLRSRSRSQVRSRSGPRSGPEGPRTKDQRPGPGLALNLVCHPLTTTTQQTFLGQEITSNHYYMTSNHVPLILAFRMPFRMTFRITFRMTFRMTFWMTLRMTFNTWDFRGVFKDNFE